MGWFAAAGTLGLIAEYFLKTTAVLTLALLAAAASRRRPAAFRHFVLSFALVGLLLLPVLSLVPVGWRTSLLPARPAGAGTGTLIPARPDVTGARAPGLDIQSPPPGAVRLPESPLASTAGGPAGAAAGLSRRGANARSPEFSSPSLSEATTSRLPATGADPLNSFLAVLWAAGLIVLFLRLAFGLAGAVKLTAQGAALGDPAWQVLLERFKALVSLRRNVRLKSHPEVLVPLTWGWRRPVVLMPAGADAWTEEERSSALFHELSHVKRADFLVMLLVRTSLAAFWFNPLCWIVYRELHKEQEIACDELVLRAGIRPSTYAASLLAFRRSAGFRWNPSAALLGMLGRSSFHERLAAILKQKLTFKEVKMKTKIMLASAVVLAVAIVGTARPAAGAEKNAVMATIVESALPAPAAFDVAPAAIAAQEKQAEKKIVVTTKDGAKKPIEIIITEGDRVKTLVLDKPLTITRGEGGHVLILSSDGKDIQVLKGEPLRLEIRGGEIELIKEGKALKVGEGGVYSIAKEGGKEGSKIVYYWAPEGKTAGAQKIQVIKEGEADEAASVIFVKRAKDKMQAETGVAAEPVKEATVVKEGPGGVKVVVKTVTEAEPEITWVAKEIGKEGAVLATKEFSGKPVEGAWVSEGGRAFAFSPARDKELLEKVRAIQGQVAAVKEKKLDFTALEASLEKLEAELAANEEKLNELNIHFEKRPAGFTIVKKIREGEVKGDVVYEEIRGDKAEGDLAVWVAEGGKGDAASAVAKIGVSTGDNSVQIVFVGKGTSPEDYERTVAKLKKELPEGCKLMEQKLDPENGTMTFKVAPPEGTKIDEKLIRKLVEIFKTEPKK